MPGQDVLPHRPIAITNAEGRWVHRFGLTERFAHWWTLGMVITALVTGLVLGDEERGGPLLTVHWASVALIGVGYLVALVVGDTRALLRATWRLFSLDRRDRLWIADHLGPFRKDRAHAEYGMFNPAQKALAWALCVTMGFIVYTGIVALGARGEDAAGPHAAAVVVAMVLVGLHVFMAVLNPATNPALRGMVRGRVRRSWAVEHHGGWVRDQERRQR
jgi:formate dehydrogenase subunit gamma